MEDRWVSRVASALISLVFFLSRVTRSILNLHSYEAYLNSNSFPENGSSIGFDGSPSYDNHQEKGRILIRN